MKKRKSIGLSLTVCLAALIVALSAPAAFAGDDEKAPRITAKVDTEVAEPLSAEEQRARSLAGAHVLIEVDRARRAVEKKDQEQALKHLDNGLELMSMIEEATPEQTLRTEIRAGKRVYTDERKTKPLEVPIFSEATQVSVYEPVEAAQQEAGEAGGPPTVREAELRYTRMALDGAVAKTHLERARKAVEDGKWRRADGALAAIQQAVLLERVDAELPLVSARDNLTLARERIDADQIGHARFALQAAADNLESYAGSLDEEQKKKLKEATERIRSLAGELDQDNASEAAGKIDRWWKQIRSWLREDS